MRIARWSAAPRSVGWMLLVLGSLALTVACADPLHPQEGVPLLGVEYTCENTLGAQEGPEWEWFHDNCEGGNEEVCPHAGYTYNGTVYGWYLCAFYWMTAEYEKANWASAAYTINNASYNTTYGTVSCQNREVTGARGHTGRRHVYVRRERGRAGRI